MSCEDALCTRIILEDEAGEEMKIVESSLSFSSTAAHNNVCVDP